MEETKDSCYEKAGQKGLEQVASGMGELALNGVVGFIKKEYGKACVRTEKAFKLYLKNAEMRYDQVKTLADLSAPRKLEGKDGIYVDIFGRHRRKKISLSTVDDLTKISKQVIITGTGGIGKSMLMRHLFLNTMHRGAFVPVLIELRKISSQDAGKLSVLDLIYTCMESFDVVLDKEQLVYSLRSGKYLFLFDGLDEVKEGLRRKTEQLIQQLSSKYPNNCYILSSRREGVSFEELETYSIVEACSMEKYQAVELIRKVGMDGEKTAEFSKQLADELYERHKDFASNPLLLTMMYITFIDNNKIPEHLADFYDNAYSALYKRHDANKEGLFSREYKCQNLGEREFKLLFAYFCFQTYFAQQYEFKMETAREIVECGIGRLGLGRLQVCADDFISDIKDIVCLIVQDGLDYKFTHRSFQTYFAAYYAAAQVADDRQKEFFKRTLSDDFSAKEEFYNMLYCLEGERFETNILEPGIREILYVVERAEDPEYALLAIACQKISVHEGGVFRSLNSENHMEIPYTRNIFTLLEHTADKDNDYRSKALGDHIIKLLDSLPDRCTIIYENEGIEIEDILLIEEEQVREQILECAYRFFGIRLILRKIKLYMEEQEEKRRRFRKMTDEQDMLRSL